MGADGQIGALEPRHRPDPRSELGALAPFSFRHHRAFPRKVGLERPTHSQLRASALRVHPSKTERVIPKCMAPRYFWKRRSIG